jgi:hypothetical protein
MEADGRRARLIERIIAQNKSWGNKEITNEKPSEPVTFDDSLGLTSSL